MKKNINVTFDHKAETLFECLGIPEARAQEIAADLTGHDDSVSESEKIEAIVKKYNDNELVFALVSLAPAEMNAALEAATAGNDTDEGVGDGDDLPDLE